MRDIEIHLQNNSADSIVIEQTDDIHYILETNPTPPPRVRSGSFGDTPKLHQDVFTRLQEPNRRVLWIGDARQGAILGDSLSTLAADGGFQTPYPSSQLPWLKTQAHLVNRLRSQSTDSFNGSMTVFLNRLGDRLRSFGIKIIQPDGSAPSVGQSLGILQTRVEITPDKVQAGPFTNTAPLPPRLQELFDRGELSEIRLVDVEVGPLGQTNDIQIVKPTSDPTNVLSEQEIMEQATQEAIESWENNPPVLLDALEKIEAEIGELLGETSTEKLEFIIRTGNDLFQTHDPLNHQHSLAQEQ